MASQKLFSDFPNVSGVPGMLTPDMTADIQQTPVDIQDQIAAYNFEKLKKADRKAEWAKAAAANSVRRDRFAGTGLNAQGWREVNPQEEKLKAAFAEVYAPQLRRTFHDQALAGHGAAGDKARRAVAHIPGHIGQYTGGKTSSSAAFNQGRVPWQGQDQERLNKTLAQMWRMETDPYLKAVGGGMSAKAVMSAMQPGQIPRGYFKGWSGAKRSASGGGGGGDAQGSRLPEYENEPLHAPVRGRTSRQQSRTQYGFNPQA